MAEIIPLPPRRQVHRRLHRLGYYCSTESSPTELNNDEALNQLLRISVFASIKNQHEREEMCKNILKTAPKIVLLGGDKLVRQGVGGGKTYLLLKGTAVSYNVDGSTDVMKSESVIDLLELYRACPRLSTVVVTSEELLAIQISRRIFKASSRSLSADSSRDVEDHFRKLFNKFISKTFLSKMNFFDGGKQIPPKLFESFDTVTYNKHEEIPHSTQLTIILRGSIAMYSSREEIPINYTEPEQLIRSHHDVLDISTRGAYGELQKAKKDINSKYLLNITGSQPHGADQTSLLLKKTNSERDTFASDTLFDLSPNLMSTRLSEARGSSAYAASFLKGIGNNDLNEQQSTAAQLNFLDSEQMKLLMNEEISSIGIPKQKLNKIQKAPPTPLPIGIDILNSSSRHKGSNTVVVDSNVGILLEGSSVSELSLLHDVPRTGHLIARTHCIALRVTSSNFKKLIRFDQCPVSIGKGITSRSEKTYEKFIILRNLSKVTLLTIPEFSDPVVASRGPQWFLRRISEEVKFVTFSTDEIISEMYESKVDLAILIRGKVRVETQIGTTTSYRYLGDESCHGELNLLYDMPRTERLVAESECSCVLLQKKDFEKVLTEAKYNKESLTSLWLDEYRSVLANLITVRSKVFSSWQQAMDVASVCIPQTSIAVDINIPNMSHATQNFGGSFCNPFGSVGIDNNTSASLNLPALTSICQTNDNLISQPTRMGSKTFTIPSLRSFVSGSEGSSPNSPKCLVLSDEVESPRGIRAKLRSPSNENDGSEPLKKSSKSILQTHVAGTVLSNPDNGDLNEHIIIVVNGKVRIKHQQDVDDNLKNDLILRDGDIYGDVAVFCPTPRHLEVICELDTTVCILDKTDIPSAVVEQVESRAWQYLRNEILFEILSNINVFVSVGRGLVKTLAQKLVYKVYHPRDYVLLEGSDGYQSMYLISKGSVNVTVDGLYSSSLRDGSHFNILGMLHATPRKFTLAATKSTHVFSITRQDFTNCLRNKHPNSYSAFIFRSAALFHTATLQILVNAVPLFANASTQMQEMLSECLKHSMYEAGSTVVEQGEGGDGMYFISRGKLSVSIDDVVVKIIKDGDFFGEVALFYDTPRTATVTAESHSHLFALSKEDFVNVATQFPLENNVIKKMAENRFYDFVLSILVKKVPLFASASVAFLNDLLRKLESKMYNSGEVVINQDDTGEEMYFVSRGELDICVNVHSLKDGDFFGEIALVYDTPRTASITAAVSTQVFVLNRTDLHSVMRKYKQEGQQILTISRQRLNKCVLNDLIRKVPMFKFCKSDDFISKIVDCLVPRGYAAGDLIVEEGNGGDEMYFVSRGELHVTVGGVVINRMQDGDFFGEIALIFDTPRTATITAATKTQVFVLHRKQFASVRVLYVDDSHIIHHTALSRLRLYTLTDLIRKVPMFNSCRDSVLIKDISEMLLPKTFIEGEKIISEGEGGDEMYFVSRGRLQVIIDGKIVHKLTDGDFFGEVSLVFDAPRTASIVAETKGSLFVLKKSSFQSVTSAYPEETSYIRTCALTRFHDIYLTMIKKVPLFSNVMMGNNLFVTSLIELLKPARHSQGTYVVREGEGGSEMYFILRGQLALTIGDQYIGRLRDGDYFGEVALLYDTPRTASIYVELDSQFLVLSQEDFLKCVVQFPQFHKEVQQQADVRLRNFVLLQMVEKVPLFYHCGREFSEDLTQLLQPRLVEKDFIIMKEHEAGNEMFFICRGEVSMHRDGEFLARVTDGGIFGEISLVYDTARVATITATVKTHLFVLSKNDFDVVMKRYPRAARLLLGVAKERFLQIVLLDLVRKVPIFKTTDTVKPNMSFLKEITSRLIPKHFNADEIVVLEGEGGDKMYFVSNGKLQITQQGSPLFILADGDFFGEIALVYDTPRTATITSVTNSQLYILTRSDFHDVIMTYPDESEGIVEIAKKRLHEHVLNDFVRDVPLFASCSEELVTQIVSALHPSVVDGVVISEGMGGNEMYFISRGRLNVSLGDKEEIVHRLQDGDFFGEIALLYDTPRTATITTDGPAQLYILRRNQFLSIIETNSEVAESIREVALNRFRAIVLEDIISKIPLFSDDDDDSTSTESFLQEVVKRLKIRSFEKDTFIIKEGEGGEEMFFVSRGKLLVYSNGKLVGKLKDGGFFGEVALLYDTPRTASIRAETKTQLFELSKKDFEEAIKPFPLKSSKVQSIAKERFRKFVLGDMVRKVPLFTRCKTTEMIEEVIDLLQPQLFPANSTVIQEGEGGSEMFFISRGSLSVLNSKGNQVHRLVDGNFFGEIAMLFDTPRTASVVTLVDSYLFSLSGEAFRDVIKKYPHEAAWTREIAESRLRKHVLQDIVKNVPIFASCKEDAFLTNIVSHLKPRGYSEGQTVITEGEGGDEMFFISRGELEIMSSNGTILRTLRDGEFFGEVALVFDTPRTATIRAAAKSQLFVLSKKDFQSVIETNPAIGKSIQTIARERFCGFVLTEFVRRVPLFQYCSQDFINCLVDKMEPSSFETGDIIIKEGHGGQQMYFVNRGILNVVVGSDGGEIVHTMKDGDFFGEVALVFETPRTASIIATTKSQLFILTKDDFNSVINEFPSESDRIRAVASERFLQFILHDIVKKVPFFSECKSSEFLSQIVQLLILKTYEQNDLIVEEGEGGDEMYFVSRGVLDVFVCGEKVTKLCDGDFFGEVALVYDTPRTASIIAVEKSQLYILTKEDLNRALIDHPEEVQTISISASIRLKQFVLFDLVRKIPMFKECTDQSIIYELVDFLSPRSCIENTTIVSQQHGGDEMYFVSRGQLAVVVDNKTVHTLKDGDFFGEVALVYDTPRTATITCLCQTQLFVLTRRDFNAVIEKYAGTPIHTAIYKISSHRFKRYVLTTLVAKVPMFEGVSQEFIHSVVEFLKPRSVSGFVIKENDDSSEEMYFVSRGELRVTVAGKTVHTMRDGDFFGEIALLYDTPRTASIIADQPTQLFILSRACFGSVIDAHPTDAEPIKKIARERLELYVLNDLVKKVPIFGAAEDANIIKRIIAALIPRSICKGGWAVKEGESANEMFFVSRGELRVIMEVNGKEVVAQSLRDGDFCGEVAMVFDTPRTASIMAAVKTQVFVLTRTSFNRILKSQSGCLKDKMIEVARERFNNYILRDLVRKVPIFSKADNNFIIQLVAVMNSETFKPGEDIVFEGQGGDQMYFISRGRLNVILSGERVFLLSDGDFFGEIALILDTPRTASVVAETTTTLYSLHRNDFNQILTRHPKIRRCIERVAKDRFNQVVLQELIKKVSMFSHCDDDFISNLVEKMDHKNVSEGDFVVREGQGGDEMFFVSRGHLDVIVSVGSEETVVSSLKDGDFFGEVALIYSTPRTASIRSTTPSTIYVLKKQHFQQLLSTSTAAEEIKRVAECRFKNHILHNLVKKVPLFADSDSDFITDLVECLDAQFVTPGQKVIREDEGGDEMYFVVRGVLSTQICGEEVHVLRDGDFFGEIALCYDTPRTATITSIGDSELFVLYKDEFTNVMMKYPKEAQQIQQIARQRLNAFVLRAIIERVPLFSQITCTDQSSRQEFISELASRLTYHVIEPPENREQYFFEEGDEADGMYFVSRGSVIVLIDYEQMFSIKDGGFFGEIALIYDIPRRGSVVIQSTVSIFKLKRNDFNEITRKYPSIERGLHEAAKIRMKSIISTDLVRYVPLFSAMRHDEVFLHEISCRLTPVVVEKDSEISLETPGLLILCCGKVSVETVEGDDDKITKPEVITPGGFFGETAMLYDRKIIKSAVAILKSTLYHFSRTSFLQLRDQYPLIAEVYREPARRKINLLFSRNKLYSFEYACELLADSTERGCIRRCYTRLFLNILSHHTRVCSQRTEQSISIKERKKTIAITKIRKLKRMMSSSRLGL